jgi:hypothetical protein
LVTVASATAGPRPLIVRTLEPGHVVATLNLQPVAQLFDIVATAPGGDQLHAQLLIAPGS